MSTRTSTSYAVLGLLALGPKTGYEIVQGHARSVGQIGSRTESVLYAEPKRLVKDGLAVATDEQRGKRTVAVYSITDEGHDALRRWLAEPSSFPVLDAEPIVRAVFSDQEDLEQLRATLTRFRADAAVRLSVLADIGEEYLLRRGLYQERFHITMLTGRFVGDLMEAYIGWCDWALEAIDAWPDDTAGRHAWAEAAITEWLEGIGRTPPRP